MGKCYVCSKPAKQTCTGCKEAVYCSKEHQIAHWKQHKVKCRPYEIQKNPELGRFLIATRDIPQGTKLISEHCLVLGPKTSTEPLCLGCYQPLDPETSSRCPSCEWPACDAGCPGLTMQDHHLPECIVFSRNPLPARIGRINYDAVFPLRCLLMQKKNPKKWKQLLSLESHFSHRDNTTDTYQEIEEKISKYLKENYLSFLEPGIITNTSSEVIHVICGIIEVNALEIATGDGEVMAIYPNACLMEHSCIPNVKYTFNLEDFKIYVESCDDIKSGEHLCTMYTHTLWGTAARQDHLKRTKYFTCKCKRCIDPTELETNFSTLKCISSSPLDVTEKCDGLVIANNGDENSDWSCTKCPLILSANHVSDLVSRLGAQVDAAMEEPSVGKLEKLISNLQKLLHPNHYHCFTVEHSLIQLWGREEGYLHNQMTDSLLNKKLETCRRLETITETLDPKGVRTGLYTGVCLLEESLALSEVAKRSKDSVTVEKTMRDARNALEKAKDVLDDTGPGSKLTSVINMTYNNVMNELKKFKIVELT
ncbi:SET domain-containing protein SmydA-8 [Halyomorpha halys]|uniref:SET domain-containing protein SmydA-8 n=1 Tax=Halyomorpha halys TaxID=286706 RepID=UPI0006D50283|nr:protein msta-like [Halyomorpha halys]